MPSVGISFQSDKSIARYRELAEAAAPFDLATVSVYQDLFFQPPWPALLQFAERTTRPLLGPAVVNPYLTHPVLVAANLALLDESSGGRAYLGVGKGAYFDAIRVPQPRPLRAIRETVELVQHLLSGERSAYEGEIFRLSAGSHLRFPIPGRRLPVMLGGWGERTTRLAGEIADLYKIGGSTNPESAAWFRERLDEGSRAAGRAPGSVRLCYGAVTVVDRDPRRAEALARRTVAMYVIVAGRLDPVSSLAPEELAAVEAALADGDEVRAGAALSKETLRRFACYGTPDEIAAQLQELFDAGVDLFELGTPHGADEVSAVRLLGEAVLSQLDLPDREVPK